MTLSEKGSKFKAMIPSNNVTVSGFGIDSLSMTETKFDIEPDITTDNGTIDIKDFFGSITSKGNALELRGNVTKLSATMGDLEWEMK
jgi:hypothetical protein